MTEAGRRAKSYTLTKAGSKQLKAEEESWDRLALTIAKVKTVFCGHFRVHFHKCLFLDGLLWMPSS
jgi:hypothetical protein